MAKKQPTTGLFTSTELNSLKPGVYRKTDTILRSILSGARDKIKNQIMPLIHDQYVIGGWVNSGNLLGYIWTRIFPFGVNTNKTHCINFGIDQNGLHLRIDTDKNAFEKINGKSTFNRSPIADSIWNNSLETIDAIKATALSAQQIADWITDYMNRHKTDYINYINAFGSTSQLPVLPHHPLPLNRILYGPPGTGKTYNTVNKALEIIDGVCQHDILRFKQLKALGRIAFVTFHQSMSYEEFVEGIKPITTSQTVTYDVKPGIFKIICEDAENDPENNYVLIIDEINRGSVSQIFGELITLIEKDKRMGASEELTVKLPYSSTCVQTGQQVKEFGVPKNLYIIGTMNTADRSVEALDTALRRRFFFEEMMPDPTLLKCTITDNNHNYCTLEDLLLTINTRLEILKDRDHLIGHSYFMKFNSQTSVSPDDLRDVFHYEIIPLLQEYFYGDYEKILMILGDGFVDRINIQSKPVVFATGGLSYSQPNYIYRLKPISGVNMLGALGSMLIQNWVP